MSDLLLWAISGLLAAVFVAANVANVSILVETARAKEGERTPSLILFVGGIAGAIALAIAPREELHAFFWVPLVLDIGTGPYLALIAIATVWQGLASGERLRHVPFLRYFVKEKPVPPREPYSKERTIVGCILGTAVGDAMGLTCEGLSRARQMKFYPELTGYRLLFGKGFASDDTEHTCMLAQSLIETGDYHIDYVAQKFASNLGWRLRFWLLGLPAGVGLATLRAILKLWIGFPTRYSGVYSAGNAPAMRVALIGVCYGENTQKMRALVRAATRITHTDLKAEHGALAVALAAHLAATGAEITPIEYLRRLRELLGEDGEEFVKLVEDVARSMNSDETAADYAARIGCSKGVTGYIYHTAPAVLHVWLAHQNDYRGAVTAMIHLGGDTDTTAAIVGAIVGARVGKAGIPPEWLRDLWEWPRTVKWMEELGEKLAARCAHGFVSGAPYVNPIKLLLRNAFFLALVLLHGFRRLLPPY